MKPIAAAVAGALISGVAMYTVGARTAPVSAFSGPAPATQGSGFMAVPANGDTTLRPAAARVASRLAPAPRPQTVGRASDAAAQPRGGLPDERIDSDRSWTKSAMVIGGSAATGAAVGGIVKGKKGALIGAAAGGGAATIYEATRRH